MSKTVKKIWSRTTSGALGGIALGIAVGTLIFGATIVEAGQPKAPKQVGPWDAMTAATAKAGGGKGLQATYVNEGGKYIYDVIVLKGKTLMEVEVDAATGKAGSTETVTPAEEGKELSDELTKAIGGKVSASAEKDEKDEKDEKAGGKPKPKH